MGTNLFDIVDCSLMLILQLIYTWSKMDLRGGLQHIIGNDILRFFFFFNSSIVFSHHNKYGKTEKDIWSKIFSYTGLLRWLHDISFNSGLYFHVTSLLYIETADRPGLLVEIIKIIADININVESAEIDTEVCPLPPSFVCCYDLTFLLFSL